MMRLTDAELIQELQSRFEENTNALDELKNLTDKLQVVNSKLKQSEALKTNFLSNIRNEIVNPFSSIIGLSKNIINANKESWKDVISMASLIHSEAFYLDFQLKNIFMAAEIEAGELQLESYKIKLHDFLKDTIDHVKHLSKKKKISIKWGDQEGLADSSFNTDPGKFQLIILNLLFNAIEFSNEDSIVEVSAFVEKDNLKVSVKDYGRGIDEASHQVIFDRFKRLNTNIHNQKGHGLGLAVVGALVEFMDGTVGLVSEVDKGADFTISLKQIDESKTLGTANEGDELFFDEAEKF